MGRGEASQMTVFPNHPIVMKPVNARCFAFPTVLTPVDRPIVRVCTISNIAAYKAKLIPLDSGVGAAFPQCSSILDIF
jgi:hypothetical protein